MLIVYILTGIVVLLFSLCAFFTLFPIVKIMGMSMHPTLVDGEIYLGRKVFRKTKCKVGEIYVFKSNHDPHHHYIKRLTHINTDGDYYFLGDNTFDSYDSRDYGYVDNKQIVAHLPIKTKE